MTPLHALLPTLQANLLALQKKKTKKTASVRKTTHSVVNYQLK